jgi:hypothetical protein
MDIVIHHFGMRLGNLSSLGRAYRIRGREITDAEQKSSARASPNLVKPLKLSIVS